MYNSIDSLNNIAYVSGEQVEYRFEDLINEPGYTGMVSGYPEITYYVKIISKNSKGTTESDIYTFKYGQV
jgi:hypothetical protein